MKFSLRTLVAGALAATTVSAVDISTIEGALKEFGDSPCRLELLALGISFINVHGCATSANSWSELEKCRDKVFEFLETGGQILKKDKCAEPLGTIINKKIIDIDLKPVFQVFMDLYDCTKSQNDISVCHEQAMSDLLKIGSLFANELMDGMSAETEQLAINGMEHQHALEQCSAGSPLLSSALTKDEFSEFAASSRDLFNSFNYFTGGPFKRLLDAKQEWALDRVLELVEEQSPLYSRPPDMKAESFKDLRRCSEEWTTLRGDLQALMQSPDLHSLHMRIFNRLPFLNPLRPWYQAYFDNVDMVVSDVLPRSDCLFTWKTSADLNECAKLTGSAMQSFVSKLMAAEKMEVAQDYKEGWTEDHAVLSTHYAPPTHVPINAYTPPESSGGHWVLRGLWHSILTLLAAAAVVAAAVYGRKANLVQRWRGFRAFPHDADVMDAEAQQLLREVDESDGSDDELLDI